MSLFNEPKHDEPRSDDEHRAYMDGIIRRQRMWIMAIALFLVAALGFSYFGCGLPPMQGEPTQTTEGHQSSSTPQTPTSGTPGAANGTPSTAPSTSSLKSQVEATRTESMVIVTWPTQEMIMESSTFPIEKRWLPACVEAIGMDLCDRNRALEDGFMVGATRWLPRMGQSFQPSMLSDTRVAAEVEHIVAVEFQKDGSAWRVHRHSHGGTVASGPWFSWPQKNVTATLIEQIAEAVQQATEYSLSTVGVFTVHDDAARAFAKLEVEIATFRRAGGRSDEIMVSTPDAAVERAVGAVLSIDPAMDFAVYRRSLLLWEVHQRALAVTLLRDRLAAGSTSPRLPGLYGKMLVDYGEASKREQGLTILKAEIEKDRLNMKAHSYWSNGWYSRPDDGTGETGSLSQAKEGMASYPNDGRYHALMARELSINPDTAEEAIGYAQQALRLRPWAHSVGFHIGMAKISQRQYTEGAGIILEHWAFDHNRLQQWIEMIANGLTRNARALPGPRVADDAPCDQLTGFVYMLTIIARHLANGQNGSTLDRLFERRRAVCEEYVRTLAQSAKPEDPNYVIILMADIAQKLVDAKNNKLGTQQESHAIILAAIKKYRDWGGRAPEIERLWQASQLTKRTGS